MWTDIRFWLAKELAHWLWVGMLIIGAMVLFTLYMLIDDWHNQRKRRKRLD